MSQLKIKVNDREYDFDTEKINIDDLLKRLSVSHEGIAVCVNGDIVRKARYSEYYLKNGDKVDIITMVGGG